MSVARVLSDALEPSDPACFSNDVVETLDLGRMRNDEARLGTEVRRRQAIALLLPLTKTPSLADSVQTELPGRR